MAERSFKSVAAFYDGPWMPPEMLAALPQLGRDYARVAASDRDSITQDTIPSQTDSEGRGSNMVKRQRPKAALKPPDHIARAVDESAFRKAWLAEQRAAIMHLVSQDKDRGSHEVSKQLRQQPER